MYEIPFNKKTKNTNIKNRYFLSLIILQELMEIYIKNMERTMSIPAKISSIIDK
ncbi:MAG: hypothetical protein QXW71_02855 [Thermoplasmata archaeon]